MNEEEAITADDQLRVISDWLADMQHESDKERLSYSEISDIQAVYDIIKIETLEER